MDILNKLEEKISERVTHLKFDVEYVPGVIEEDDSFRATHKLLGLNCYGSTEEEALENARNEAHGLFLLNMELMVTVLI